MKHSIICSSLKLFNRLYHLQHLEKRLGLGLERSRSRLEAKTEGLVSVSKEKVSFTSLL